MPLFARIAFAAVDFAARKGLAAPSSGDSDSESKKHRAQRTGVRGETYAYWYLRRHGYVLVARNYMSPGMKGEIDLVGYDGRILAFVEVKTRAAEESSSPTTRTMPALHAARAGRQLGEAAKFETDGPPIPAREACGPRLLPIRCAGD